MMLSSASPQVLQVHRWDETLTDLRAPGQWLREHALVSLMGA